jgi:phage tail-like protein
MAQFSVNTHRFDPYRNFKFRLKIDNAYVAGLNRCSALRRTTDVIDWRDGGDPTTVRRLPGRTLYQPITLEAGVTHDTTFEQWASLAHRHGGDAGMSLRSFRKDLILDIFNLAGQKVISYRIYRCWVSEYQALPELDASANAVMIQTLTLQTEGWERDPDVVEPTER